MEGFLGGKKIFLYFRWSTDTCKVQKSGYCTLVEIFDSMSMADRNGTKFSLQTVELRPVVMRTERGKS